ncbi:MAG: hypothetical protein HOE93_05500 [Nitrosopumilus sp.]|nr:hypothetical protein [Nitrosopumilus sp.]MBT3574257.1 hypothetical protein [Nitrosopumilus sp.]MBT3956746.1 hypothetical protein [Nitrosopumilus sp.]MBT4298972.1 hypothetical protein [Nitrosopumilus sp.]MBT4535373.1 hypothetical protein [Nitrosopumilus sp.]
MQLSSSQQQGLVFGGAFLVAGIVLSTMVFPFWHLIREDVFEDVVILNNDNGTCFVETIDSIPKTIENCVFEPGDSVTIKFGEGLAWATVVTP